MLVKSSFSINRGQLGPCVADVTIFPSIEFSWGLVLVTSRISINRGHLGSRVGGVLIFPSLEVIWGPMLVTSRFLDDIYIIVKRVSVYNEK